ncbi:hypothetical protein H8S95_01930 [Pontibacter sp. KCTC 32443]|uniref:hypothetical protein n=1 Tax=Pontibacter TaxID=323449 RepID=UPI00164D937B|nr:MULTISPECIES: hypothetical protein [Pontibacter]MBC5772808.1 hypothetical protein [Pontibacter sp. KCTC 32443]
MKLRLLFFAFSLLFLISCDDEENEDVQMLDATITWTGKYETDGCGYIISTGDRYPRHKPINESAIPESYRTGEPIAVRLSIINYKKNAISCMMGRQYNQIMILKIHRR